jgi:signal peptidase I
MSNTAVNATEKQKWYSAGSILPLIYLVVALFALRWTIVEPYVVPTGSMEPTLKTGDRLYAWKAAYDVRFPFTDWVLFRTGALKHGDVILFKNPRDTSITFVKRAIGLPGDKIAYQDGRLFVNGKEIEDITHPDRVVMYDIDNADEKTLYLENLFGVEHYVIKENMPTDQRQYIEMQGMPFRDVTVPEGYFFAVGDNRDNSSDSRVWGFAPLSYLKGKAMFIWFSSWDFRVRFERIGTLIQ